MKKTQKTSMLLVALLTISLLLVGSASLQAEWHQTYYSPGGWTGLQEKAGDYRGSARFFVGGQDIVEINCNPSAADCYKVVGGWIETWWVVMPTGGGGETTTLYAIP